MNFVSILLDETGSMSGQETRVVTGINEYINKLRTEIKDDDCKVMLNLFDSERWDTFFDGDLKDFPKMDEKDYNPQAMTPLNDAIAKVISAMKVKAVNGDKVIIVIDTDGQENASKEHNVESIKALVAECEKEGWAFIFMASGIDKQQAINVSVQAESLGVSDSNTVVGDHSVRGAMYQSSARASSQYFAGTKSNTNLFDEKDKPTTDRKSESFHQGSDQ